ncbi:MAG: four helix bundle protein [Acidobacteria bacterium]|nr:four helix bundle protein [Acidobacteriota bacterium]
MAERFEDLKVWQKSRDLTRTIYELSGKKTFSNDRPLSNQIRKAAISITSNIAEGFERTSGLNSFVSIDRQGLNS